MKHSKIGIIAFFVSICFFIILVFSFILGFMQRWNLIVIPMTVLYIGFLSCIIILPIGLIVNVIAIFKKQSSKFFPILSLSIYGFGILIFVGVFLWTESLKGSLTDITLKEYRYDQGCTG